MSAMLGWRAAAWRGRLALWALSVLLTLPEIPLPDWFAGVKTTTWTRIPFETAWGRPVFIHAYEPEGKESLLMLAREILFGKMTKLLDDLIIIICPNFCVDGNDALSLNEGTPHFVGSGSNAQGLNLNRDAVRVDTVEVAGLYRNVYLPIIRSFRR